MEWHLLHPKKSYGLSSKSEFFKKVVINHLVHLNESQGIHKSMSVFGTYFLIDDVHVPAKNRFIISAIKRDEKGFTNIDLDKNWNKIMSQLFGIDYNPSLSKLITKNTTMDRLYHVFALLTGSTTNKTINNDTFKRVISGEAKLSHSYGHKLNSLIMFVNNPTNPALTELLTSIDESSYGWMVSAIDNIINNGLSPYYADKYSHITSTNEFIKNLLKIAAILLKTDNFEDAILTFYTIITD